MKTQLIKLITVFLLKCFAFFQADAQTNSNHVYVSGYTKANGTYVAPYYRTAPNSTNRDNLSTIGNVNPYTGQPGYIKPDNNPIPTTQAYSTSTSNTYSYTGNSNSTNTYHFYSNYYTTANLNLRSGPGTTFTIALTIPNGSSLQVINENTNGWWYVLYQGQYGYVSSTYLQMTQK